MMACTSKMVDPVQVVKTPTLLYGVGTHYNQTKPTILLKMKHPIAITSNIGATTFNTGRQ